MSHIIELKDICKSYEGKKVLKNLTLNIERGTFLAITGKSGAGKSTLLNIMGLLEKPDSGTISICGVTNPTLRSADGKNLLRNNIGYLFQNFGLIDEETVLYNLNISCKFNPDSRKKEKISEALSKVGLPGIEKKKIYQLSGGEQQRVSVAKLILKSPEIILADEPTGSLDSENRDRILELLNQMNKIGKTIVVVTHDATVRDFAKENIEI